MSFNHGKVEDGGTENGPAKRAAVGNQNLLVGM
jgi:hypothetical protein